MKTEPHLLLSDIAYVAAVLTRKAQEASTLTMAKTAYPGKELDILLEHNLKWLQVELDRMKLAIANYEREKDDAEA